LLYSGYAHVRYGAYVLGSVAASVELHRYVAVCTCCIEIVIGGAGVGAIVGTGVGVGAIVGTGVGVGAIVGRGVGVGAIVGTGVGVGAIVGRGVGVGAVVAAGVGVTDTIGASVGAVLGSAAGVAVGATLGEADGTGVAAGPVTAVANTAADVEPFPVTVTCDPTTGDPESDVFETIATSIGGPPERFT